MTRWFAIAALCACIFVPQASAKGPIELCGANRCVQVGSEQSGLWWSSEHELRGAPVAPAPFLRLRFADIPGTLAYWIPEDGVVRTAPQGGAGVWVRPTTDQVKLLTQAGATLRAFAAPKRATVTVGYRDVPRGGSTYLRLFTMGVPVAGASGARGWTRVLIWTGDTPWSYGMWVSRAGAFLKRADAVVRISSALAERIRNRLPLTR